MTYKTSIPEPKPNPPGTIDDEVSLGERIFWGFMYGSLLVLFLAAIYWKITGGG